MSNDTKKRRRRKPSDILNSAEKKQKTKTETKPDKKEKPESNPPSMEERAEQAELSKNVKISPLYDRPVWERLAQFEDNHLSGKKKITPAMVAGTITELWTMTAVEFQYFLKYKAPTTTMYERSLAHAVADSQNQTKTSINSREQILNRLVGNPKNIQEISGPDGQPLNIKSDEQQMEEAFAKMSPEKREAVAGILEELNRLMSSEEPSEE